MIMTRNLMVKMISEMLKDKFHLETLKDLKNRLNQGEYTNVFSDALNKAIDSKIADEWQQENQMGV